MAVESEAKFIVDGSDTVSGILSDERIKPFVIKSFEKQMHAEYFDTDDGYLTDMRAALRMRRENEKNVCCIKLGERQENGIFSRSEFECEAQSISDGLDKLAVLGAPQAVIAELKEYTVICVCRTDFLRRAYIYQNDRITAEIAFDCGTISAGGGNAEICELEIELKDGRQEDFAALCEYVKDKFGLTAQQKSKFARGLELFKGQRADRK